MLIEGHDHVLHVECITRCAYVYSVYSRIHKTLYMYCVLKARQYSVYGPDKDVRQPSVSY